MREWLAYVVSTAFFAMKRAGVPYFSKKISVIRSRIGLNRDDHINKS